VTLSRLFERLRHLTWDWRLGNAEEIVSAIAGDPVSRVAGRVAYRLDGMVDVSLYHDDERAIMVEFTVEAFPEPHRLTSAGYEDKVDEYFMKYEGAVAEAERVLGEPAFNDGAAATGFPEDQDAVWLALWPANNARLMVEQKHEDRELPLRLCVVVAPP
jgi:hypothetical protein